MNTPLVPFVRHLAWTSALPNSFFVRSRDCRIFYVTEGRGQYALLDRCFPLSPGTLIYTPAGSTYYPQSDAHHPLRFYTLNFDFDQAYADIIRVQAPCRAETFDPASVLAMHLPNHLSIFQNPIFLEHMQELDTDFSLLLAERKRQALFAQERVSALLAALLYKIARYAAVGHRATQTVDSVLEYINTYACHPLRNSDIGRALNYHPYYINELVKRHTGKTLHQYVLEVRMRTALQLLMDTRLSIAEIAEQTGFENPNHFSAAFRRWCGMRPTDYR